MIQRIITAIGILAVTIPPLVLGGIWLDILMAAFVLLAVYEILTCLFKNIPWGMYAVLLAAVAAMSVSSLTVFAAVMPIVLILLFLFCVSYEQYSVDKISIVFVFVVLVTFTVRAIRLVYDVYHPLAMLHIVLATYATDTGAYFAGRFFGKHKLNERISPKKTIEGSIGGWLLGAGSSLAFGYFLVPELPVQFLCLTSLLMPIVGQLGDLAFSAIKRHEGIKDFGHIFPGHGGVLDRIDSLIFNLMLWMSFYLMFVMVM